MNDKTLACLRQAEDDDISVDVTLKAREAAVSNEDKLTS